MEIVALHQVLAEIETAKSFTVRYVEADINRRTGGRIAERLATKLKNSDSVSKVTRAKNGKPTVSRDPNHYDHFTFNVKDLHTDQIHKIHARLIVGFNDKTVRY